MAEKWKKEEILESRIAELEAGLGTAAESSEELKRVESHKDFVRNILVEYLTIIIKDSK